jgi:hypothetical protein
MTRFWTNFTRLPPPAVRGRGLAERLGILRGRAQGLVVPSVASDTILLLKPPRAPSRFTAVRTEQTRHTKDERRPVIDRTGAIHKAPPRRTFSVSSWRIRRQAS